MRLKMFLVAVPDHLQRGLDAELLRRFGSVVRDHRGQIVDHLDEFRGLDLVRQAGRTALMSLDNRKVAGAMLLGRSAVEGRAAFRTARDRQLQQFAADLISARREYLQAVEGGTLTEDVIDRLVAVLDRFEAPANRAVAGRVKVSSRPESLVFIAAAQTRRLAEANAVALTGLPEVDPIRLEGTLGELREHLQAQRRLTN